MNTLYVVLFILACAVMIFLCMPGAVLIAKWVEELFPGLLENLAFWSVIVVFTLAVLFVLVPPR